MKSKKTTRIHFADQTVHAQKHNSSVLTLSALVDAICRTDKFIAARVGMAVNTGLTLRNWVIGFYIYEYEQRGADRAEYEQIFLIFSQRNYPKPVSRG